MTEQLLPDHLTFASAHDVYAAMRLDWPLVMGAAPRRATLICLLSQWAFETGRGRAMHAFNTGNIKHVPGDGHDFVQFRCNEIIGGKAVWFDPPHPATSFRAYASLADGVRDYLDLLMTRFGSAWGAAIAGDVAAFSRELHAQGYYTADEAIYTHGLVTLCRDLDVEVGPDAGPDWRPPPVAPVRVVDKWQPTPPGDLPPPDDVA